MKKSEFMRELEAALQKVLPAAKCREILVDFEDHFNEALLAGDTEESVCQVLGDPREIAAQCIDSQLWEDTPPGGTTPPSLPGEGTGRLLVDLSDYSLVCSPCNGAAFRVEVRKNGILVQDDDIQVYQESDVIGIRQNVDPRRNFLDYVFRFPENKVVHVDVPSAFPGSVEVKVRSGSIRMSGLSHLASVSCGTSSGTITMEEITTAEALRAVAGSGSVKLDHCHGRSIHAESHSGSAKLESCSGRTDARSRSGSVKVHSHKGYVTGRTTSGSVIVETDAIHEDTEFRTKSGSVKVTLDRLTANMLAESVSGSVKVEIDRLEGNLTGKTVSGSATCTLGEGTQAVFRLKGSGKDKRYCTGPTEAGLPVVTLTTVSGSAKTNITPWDE